MSHIKRDENGDVDREKTWAFEERRLRRRQVYAQELIALALMSDDVHASELIAVRETAAFQRLVQRLTHAAP